MDRRWKGFVYRCAGAFGAVVGLALALLVLFDPYHNIPFAPPFERHFMENNQRYMYPSLARNQDYDSALLGTSAVRMLPPERLDEGFAARFAYLAFDAGTPWEQLEIARLFYRHHPEAKTVVYGVDRNWCSSPSPYPRLTRRPFPPWMYDENPYNDLQHLLNDKALEVATRQLRYYLGLDITRYDQNGFEDFLPDDSEYDLAKARRKIYGDEGAQDLPALAARAPVGDTANMVFPDHGLFAEFLEITPAQTRLIVVFPPHHAYAYLRSRDRFDACKARIADLVHARRPDAAVLDLMVYSSFTGEDANYWDDVHYSREAAGVIADLIIAGADSGISPAPDLMVVRRAPTNVARP